MATHGYVDWEYLARYLGRQVGEIRRLPGVELFRLVADKIDEKQARVSVRAERSLHVGAPSGAAGSSRRTPRAQ
jgi:hypothetical protein